MKHILVVIFVVIAASTVGYATVMLRPATEPALIVQESFPVSTSTPVTRQDLPKLSRDQAYLAFKAPFSVLSTKEGDLNFRAAISVLATTSTDMVFKGCEPTPLVLQVQNGGAFMLRNAGTSTIAVRVSPTFNYSIDSGKTVDASLSIQGSTTFATISCMGRGPVGAVSISR